MFDAEQRLSVCNRRYRETYALTPDQVKPGTTVRQMGAASLAQGASREGPRPRPSRIGRSLAKTGNGRSNDLLRQEPRCTNGSRQGQADLNGRPCPLG
jgi:hypothetical protein